MRQGADMMKLLATAALAALTGLAADFSVAADHQDRRHQGRVEPQ
jgi:hypothetical protein